MRSASSYFTAAVPQFCNKCGFLDFLRLKYFQVTLRAQNIIGKFFDDWKR